MKMKVAEVLTCHTIPAYCQINTPIHSAYFSFLSHRKLTRKNTEKDADNRVLNEKIISYENQVKRLENHINSNRAELNFTPVSLPLLKKEIDAPSTVQNKTGL